MDPIEKWYASNKPTNHDHSDKTKEQLIQHIRTNIMKEAVLEASHVHCQKI